MTRSVGPVPERSGQRAGGFGADVHHAITELGVAGELARTLETTNLIESPNSVVRRVSGRVSHYAHMAMRWMAADFFEGEQSFLRVRGDDKIKALITALRLYDQTGQLAAKLPCPPAQTCN